MIFKFQAWERKIVIKADYSYKINKTLWLITCESSPSEVFLGKVVQKLCSKFPEENPYRSMQSKFEHAHFTVIHRSSLMIVE